MNQPSPDVTCDRQLPYHLSLLLNPDQEPERRVSAKDAIYDMLESLSKKCRRALFSTLGNELDKLSDLNSQFASNIIDLYSQGAAYSRHIRRWLRATLESDSERSQQIAAAYYKASLPAEDNKILNFLIKTASQKNGGEFVRILDKIDTSIFNIINEANEDNVDHIVGMLSKRCSAIIKKSSDYLNQLLSSNSSDILAFRILCSFLGNFKEFHDLEELLIIADETKSRLELPSLPNDMHRITGLIENAQSIEDHIISKFHKDIRVQCLCMFGEPHEFLRLSTTIVSIANALRRQYKLCIAIEHMKVSTEELLEWAKKPYSKSMPYLQNGDSVEESDDQDSLIMHSNFHSFLANLVCNDVEFFAFGRSERCDVYGELALEDRLLPLIHRILGPSNEKFIVLGDIDSLVKKEEGMNCFYTLKMNLLNNVETSLLLTLRESDDWFDFIADAASNAAGDSFVLETADTIFEGMKYEDTSVEDLWHSILCFNNRDDDEDCQDTCVPAPEVTAY